METRRQFANEQSEISLSHLWNQFVSSQNNKEIFTEYLKAFTRCYSGFISSDFNVLDCQGLNSISHLDVSVPDELLPSLKYRLLTCAEEKLVSEQQIQDAILLVQALIILSRNSRKREFVASTDFIKHVLLICDTALDRVSSKEAGDCQLLFSFVHFSLHYLECLYDPSFKWRLAATEQNHESFSKPASLDMHIVPFIYECFQRSQPDTGIQLHLLHLFGAIISGSQANSLKAICPATVDILMRVLQGTADQYSSDDGSDHVQGLTSLILRCLVTTIHAIHQATPEERQVEVGAVLDSYFQVLLKFCDSNKNISLQLTMLEMVETMFSVSDKPSLQNTFMASGICRQLLSFIRAIEQCPLHCQNLSTAAIRVFGLLLANSTTAKDKFIQMIGYDNLFEALRNLGQPTRPLLISLLELVSEKKLSKDDCVTSVKNSPVVIMLVKWLPDVDLELQSWLSTLLYQMCTADTWSLTQCSNSGINSAILECLQKRNTLDTNTVGDLLDLLESSGSQFISQTDLKQLLRLFKSDQGKRLEVWMEKRLLKAMSKMAESDNKQIPATYFQFNSPNHGIMTTSMGRWSGSGFSFHAWICLENPPSSLSEVGSARRQLYNIQMSGGSGFEAFFTAEAVLVVSVFSKKERNDIPVMDCPIVSNKWYCIDVVHTSSKRPFGQSQLCVYVDEVLHVSANLKFPALGEDVVLCKIGCGSGDIGTSGVNMKYSGLRIGNDLTSPSDSKQFPSAIDSKSKPSGFWSRLSFRNASKSSVQSQPEFDGLHGDGQEVRHGTVVSLFGQLSEVIIFMDSLIDTHVQSLYRLGPNRHLNQMKDGGVPADLPVKPLLVYHAKASFHETCLDLSGNGHHAKVAGHLCSASNIKEVINAIGGVQLLYLLLEEAAVRPGSNTDLISLEEDLARRNNRRIEEMDTLEPFFVLLRAIIQNCPINQEALLHNDGIAALGVILQKASASLLDHKFHESLKSLMSILPHALDDVHLLHEVYQHLVFDFRIWSRCEFQVCLAHVQFLLTIIKEDRKYFRKKYGVQYVLDTVRMFFGTPSSTHLSGENKREIRVELLDIVHLYVAREINVTELSQILAFVAAVQDEVLVSDVLGVVKSLLEARGKRDQIYLLLFEPGMADMLYVLLTIKDYSVDLKEKIFQIMALLLKTDRVYERNKSRLRLVDSNLFPGLVSLMVDTQPSVDMTKHMLEQVFIAESSASINAAIYIIQTLHLCDVDVKLEAVRQLMKVLLSKSTIPKLFAKQLGWQIALIRLLIRRQSHSTSSKWRSSFDEGDAPGVVQRADSTSDDPPERLIDLPHDDEPSYDLKGEDDDLLMSKFPLSSDFDPYAFPDGRSSRSFSIVSCPDAADDMNFSFKGASRSPSTFSSLSLGCDSRSRAPLNEASESDAVMIALKELGLSVRPCAENMEKTEELCLNLLIVLFLILWKGIDQTDETAWQQRGQVFAAITNTSEDNELLMSKTELLRKLLELLLQGCLIDIQDTGVSNPNNSKNALNLMKLLYQFLCLDNGVPALKFSKQLLEDLMVLLEDFSIWQTGNEWKEMEQMSLRCLLAFAAQDNSDLCGIAAARLHAMIRDRPVEKFQESCFLVGTIDDILERALHGSGDQYGFLIQVMKSLLEKCDDLLNIPSYLPSLPTVRNSTSFMEAFKTYSRSEQWIAFIKKQVQPSKDQYLVNIYEGLRIQMTAFMGECHEEMMVAGHKRNREKGEAKLKFEEEFVSTFKNCSRQENKRFKSIRLQLHNQNLAAWRQWTLTKAFFTSERGMWPDKNTFPTHWKLSLNENYSRMRPKMIPNEKFDNHLDASRLRDNEGSEETNLAFSELSLMNEVRAKESAGDDRLEDDDWNLISSTEATNVPTSNKETMLSEECELVTITEVIKGRLDVTSSHIYFFDCTPLREDGGIVDLKWSLDEIKEIHFRRHNLQRSALEIFLVDQTNYFINFQKKVRNKVYSRILSLRPPNLIYNQSRSPAELLKASGLTQKWIQMEISNFDYLMCLNTIAGRTYNDLSQYPVFPWVLSDYTSETLDLKDPRSYRDLSLPIGVVNPKNEKQVREKYEHFEDPTGTVAKFHYGTHYSNPAGVMHYLIRVEPFTMLHIQLQSGRFDVADRQFNSVPAMWDGLMDNPTDVKELIPEFFYLPEFLLNLNDFDLGRLQFGDGRVEDVILPRWASTPYEFIHKHRMALESDYVSEHLHNWIDLIFGYKQQGPAAIEALNVFYYCTYEGAVDLETVTDEKRRRAFEGMINNFGQTPCQLLKEPHPKRMTLQEITSRTTKPERLLKVFLFPDKLNTFTVEAAPPNDPLVFVMIPRSQTTSFISHWTTENMVAVTESGIVCNHGWLPYDKNITGFFTFDRDLSMNNIKTRKKLPGPVMPGQKVTSKMFALSHDAKLLISCGHWDNSLRVYNFARNKQVAHVVRHRDIVTCVSLDRSSRRLISGSRDTTCMIWEIVHLGGASSSINPQPLHVLYGHDDHVTCVAIATELDMAVSGSRDGTVIVHTVKQGTYLRTLRPPYEKGWQLNIQLLALSYMGQLCVYCQHRSTNSAGHEQDKLSLHLYSVNGKHLSKELLPSPISDMIITGDHLILGHVSGLLLIKELYGLCLLSTIQYHQPVTCVVVANEGSHVLCALADSSLIIVAVNRSSPQ